MDIIQTNDVKADSRTGESTPNSVTPADSVERLVDESGSQRGFRHARLGAAELGSQGSSRNPVRPRSKTGHLGTSGRRAEPVGRVLGAMGEKGGRGRRAARRPGLWDPRARVWTGGAPAKIGEPYGSPARSGVRTVAGRSTDEDGVELGFSFSVLAPVSPVSKPASAPGAGFETNQRRCDDGLVDLRRA